MKVIAIITAAIFISAGLGITQEVSFTGAALFSGYPKDLAVMEDYAYLAAGNCVVAISISDTTRLELVGGVCLPDTIRKIAIDSSFIYVAANRIGLQIIDASDPSSLRVISGMPTSAASAVAVDGHYAFVANSNGRNLHIFDVADPANPIQVGICGNLAGSFSDIAVSGGYAYLADTLSRLVIVSISDPSSPAFVSSISTHYNATGVAVRDTLAFVTCSRGVSPYSAVAFKVFDISDPANPALIGNYEPEYGDFSEYLDISLVGDSAFVASPGEASPIMIFIVSDPTNPHPLPRSWPTFIQLWPQSVFFRDNILYSAGYNALGFGLSRFNISNISNPRRTGIYISPEEVGDVDVAGNSAYVCAHSTGLYSVDVADPARPIINCRTDEFSGNVIVEGGYCFVFGWRFSIYDIASSDTLALVGSIYAGSTILFDIAGDYAYLINRDSSFIVIDVSDPTAPDSVGALGGLGDLQDVTIIDNYAYAASGQSRSLKIIDISDPIHPVLAGNFNTPYAAYGIAVDGAYAYVAQNMGRLSVVNVSNPAAPSLVLNLPISVGKAVAIDIQGNFAFIACDTAGIVVLDISDPHSPVEIDRYNTPGVATRICFQSPFIYVADRTSLQILQLNSTGIRESVALPSHISLSQNYPNPFNGTTTIEFALARASDIRLDIFDILGRKVASLFEGFQTAGRHRVVWDAGGLSSGVYFYRLSSEENSRIGRCLLVK